MHNVRDDMYKVRSRSSFERGVQVYVKPSRDYWQAVKWILMYLKGIRNKGIMFERQQGDACITGFVDSDYAGDLDERRSTMGYVFTCSGGPVSWRSMLQSISTLSTTEVEYMAWTELQRKLFGLKVWQVIWV